MAQSKQEQHLLLPDTVGGAKAPIRRDPHTIHI